MNLLPGLSLWQREMVRFLRQRNRVVGALLTPVVFWILLGCGLGNSFRTSIATGSGGYLEFFFAGTLLMILLFTAIFSTISVIEDRREGFLQAVLVAPVGHSALVIGKVLGGASLALLQGGIFLALAPLIHIQFSLPALTWLLVVMILLSIGLTGLGFIVAWPFNSTAGYHAIMNLFLLPLWFLSGALFPASGAAGWLQWIMRVNPLAYGLTAIRYGLYWNQPAALTGAPGKTTVLIVTAVFAVAMLLIADQQARRSTRGDLQ